MNRRKSREIAMELLFEMSINKESYEEILGNFKENTDTDLNDIDFDYLERVVTGVQENTKDIDKKIVENLKNWKFNRLSKVDLAILRIAIFEIMFSEDVPDKVAVNEGIELARKYSSDNSPTFVNGVLGNIIKAE